MQRIKRRRLSAEAWRELLTRFGGSGMTIEAFCRREVVSAASFYRWRTMLGRPARDLTVAAPVRIRPKNTFVDLGTLGAPCERHERVELRLDLGGGLTLQLVRS